MRTVKFNLKFVCYTGSTSLPPGLMLPVPPASFEPFGVMWRQSKTRITLKLLLKILINIVHNCANQVVQTRFAAEHPSLVVLLVGQMADPDNVKNEDEDEKMAAKDKTPRDLIWDCFCEAIALVLK